jgi:hypothetical protein
LERLAIEEYTKMVKGGLKWPWRRSNQRPQRELISRPFTIFDAMTLIGASAVAFAVVRAYTVEVLRFELIALAPFHKLWLTAYLYLIVVLPLPLTWSLAAFLLGFRSPRPPFRHLSRQPGIIACGAVSTVIAIRVAGFVAFWLRTALNNHYLFGLNYWIALTMPFNRLARGPISGIADYAGPYFSTTAFGASAAVTTAWLLSFASGQWRPQPHWLDRMGRVLGWFWVAIIPFSCWWDYNVLG